MKFKDMIKNALGRSWEMLFVYIPVWWTLFAIGSQDTIPVKKFTMDPNAIAHKYFYYGLVSNLGLLFWSAASCICIFSFVITRNSHRDELKMRLYILLSGIFTYVLMVDDMFMLHEDAFPNFLAIPEVVVIATYVVLTSLLYLVFIREVFSSEYGSLLIALVLFVISVTNDLIHIPETQSFAAPLYHFVSKNHFLFEDGSKFFGQACWFVYYVKLCYSFVCRKGVFRQE